MSTKTAQGRIEVLDCEHDAQFSDIKMIKATVLASGYTEGELRSVLESAPELAEMHAAQMEALREAERVIRWAAQESNGRVKAKIVGGWIHHADHLHLAIAKAEGREYDY